MTDEELLKSFYLKEKSKAASPKYLLVEGKLFYKKQRPPLLLAYFRDPTEEMDAPPEMGIGEKLFFEYEEEFDENISIVRSEVIVFIDRMNRRLATTGARLFNLSKNGSMLPEKESLAINEKEAGSWCRDYDEVHELHHNILRALSGNNATLYENVSRQKKLLRNCAICEKVVKGEDFYLYLTRDGNRRKIHHSCSAASKKCSCCSLYFNPMNGKEVDGKDYCFSCFNEKFVTCQGCGKIYAKDPGVVFTTCSGCDVKLCPSCSHDHICARDIVQNTNFDSTPLVGHRPGEYITDPRLIGVEIELERKNRNDVLKNRFPQGVGIGPDGSLHDGVELKTPPASLDALEDVVNKTCEECARIGLEAENTCGMHIHLDASDFRSNEKKLQQVLYTYYAMEDTIFLFLPKTRRDNYYCKKLKRGFEITPESLEHFHVEPTIYKTMDQRRIKSMEECHHVEERYFHCNIHSVFSRGTLEIRSHSGTRNPEKILQWAAFHQAVVRWALDKYSLERINEINSMRDERDRSQEFLKTVGVPEKLFRYLMDRFDEFYVAPRYRPSEEKMSGQIEYLQREERSRHATTEFDGYQVSTWDYTESSDAS